MDNNTKNILYPKGSIFRMLESDVISSELEIARGAIVEAVSDIEVDDEYAVLQWRDVYRRNGHYGYYSCQSIQRKQIGEK